jgi:hypothetical protein
MLYRLDSGRIRVGVLSLEVLDEGGEAVEGEGWLVGVGTISGTANTETVDNGMKTLNTRMP